MLAGRQLGVLGEAQLGESCRRAERRVWRAPMARVRVPRVHDQSDRVLFLSHEEDAHLALDALPDHEHAELQQATEQLMPSTTVRSQHWVPVGPGHPSVTM